MLDLPPASKHTTIDWSQVEQKPAIQPPSDAETGTHKEDLPPVGADSAELVKQQAADMQANRGLRAAYAEKAYRLASGCIQAWFVLLSVHGIIYALTGKAMWSDTVLIAITTGVTVSVLAAFLGVIRGLFPSKESPSDKPLKNEDAA